MTATTASPFTLVVGNDFSPASGFAFDQAFRVARRIPGSQVHVLHVIAGEADAAKATDAAGRLRLYIEEKVNALGDFEHQSAGIHVRFGRPARELAQFARDVNADLLVVGTHAGPHLKQVVVGSVVERLLVAASCPVFVAGPLPSPKAEAHDPVIEPPCPDCLRARQTSAGKDWWCQRHAQHHAKAHSYSFQRELPFRTHDSAITPTGIDMK
jgi:nucleotide-binding universal stress UspA family protein